MMTKSTQNEHLPDKELHHDQDHIISVESWLFGWDGLCIARLHHQQIYS